MSHPEKSDASIKKQNGPKGGGSTAFRPIMKAGTMKMLAGMRRLCGSLALLFAGVLVLASCGGGTSTSTSSTASAAIAPFKGQYSSGATVALKDANGNAITLLSGGTINANGVANVTFGANVTYPILVEVTGSYYNENTSNTEASAAPLRGLMTSASATNVPVTVVTETAVADLENRLGAPSAANPITAVAATAALNTAGAMLGIPATAVPTFDPVTHRTDDANTLRLAALAVVANGQAGATLADKVKTLANSLATLPPASAPTAVINQAAFDTALATVNSGLRLTTGATAPAPATISTSSYATLYANSGATAYPNRTLLVSGAALNISAANQVIIDTRSAANYAAGHIPGAINIPPSALDTTASSYELNTPTAIAAVLGAAGVSNTANIVLYDADVYANVGRVFWALEYLGATKVSVLDGGYAKWVADGRTVVTAATTLAATTFTPAVVAARLAAKTDVAAHYADTANYAIIDSRNNSDYVTAHIPNAVNILTTDFLNADKTLKSYADIRALLDAKGATAGKTVITNCYVGYRSGQEYFILRLMGFNVSNYDGSWTEWAADTTLPTQASLLVSGAALNVSAANQVIIDTRSASLYAVGHIPGAINIPPSALDTTASSYELNTPTAIAAVLGAAGVSNTANIVLYDADVYANVGRVFWALEYLGATKVSVLDGGYAKWVADGRTVTTTATTPLPATTFTPTVVATRLAAKTDVAAHYADTANYAIIDSRNNSDYVTAHIPNAVSILTTDFLNADKTVKSYGDIKALLDAKGVTTGKTVITHCYVGYRSGQEYFILRNMGFNVSNYDGSWTEWAADPAPLPTSLPMLLSAAALDVNAANQVIIDTRSATNYAVGHITNAINLPPSTLDTTSATVPTDTSELRTPSAIAAILGAAGVSHIANIVLYGTDTDASTGRLFWVLDYLGARNVSILDGGNAKWVADGRTRVTTATTLPPATFTPAVNATALATKADVVAHYADTANYAIIDSRDYNTNADPLKNYVTAHIPNAASILTGDFLNADKTVKLPADIKTLLDGKGVTAGKTVITHCYVGYRSGQEYFMLKYLGFKVSNYDGSWTEWFADTTPLPTRAGTTP